MPKYRPRSGRYLTRVRSRDLRRALYRRWLPARPIVGRAFRDAENHRIPMLDLPLPIGF